MTAQTVRPFEMFDGEPGFTAWTKKVFALFEADGLADDFVPDYLDGLSPEQAYADRDG
jgi:hypothetical protein